MGHRMLAVLLLGGVHTVASELELGIHDAPPSIASKDSRSLQEVGSNDWMQSILQSAGADPESSPGRGGSPPEAAAAAQAEASPKTASAALGSVPDKSSSPVDESGEAATAAEAEPTPTSVASGAFHDANPFDESGSGEASGDGDAEGGVETSGDGASGASLQVVGPMLAATMGIASHEVKAVSDDGVLILEGMLETFVHRGALTEAQRQCVNSGADDMAHLAYNASLSLSGLVMTLVTPFAKPPLSGAAAASGQDQLSTAFSLAATALELSQATPMLQQRIKDLIHHLQGYLKQCHAEGVEDALKVAARHMADVRFVAGGFVTNGADILQELEAAAMDFQQEKFHDFGREMGKTFRKVLLTGNSTMLPEGRPLPEDMSKIMMGILEAFVGPGYVVELSGKTLPSESLEAAMDEEPAHSPSHNIHQFKYHLDLHKCIEEDRELFETVLGDVYVLFSQLELGLKPAAGGQIPLPEMIMSVMGQLPGALQKCGVGKDPGRMFADAMQAASMHTLDVTFSAPQNGTLQYDMGSSPPDMAGALMTATDDWHREHYFRLGKDLGGVMREWLLIGFSGLYAVDVKTGRLFRHHGSLVSWTELRPTVAALLVPGLLGLALFASRARRGVAKYTSVGESDACESSLQHGMLSDADLGA